MVNWRKADTEIDAQAISKVEKLTGVEIPAELKELVLANNHGRPDKMLFDTESSKEHVLGALLNFNPDKEHADNVVNVFNTIKDELPPNYFPFASDPAGNFICVKTVQGKIEGVYFWNHETQFMVNDNKISVDNNADKRKLHKVELINKSLHEFLDNLYSEEE